MGERRSPRRRQSAYQIVVDGLWDSGKVESDQSVHVVYAGPALKSRQRCQWKVRTWDMNGEPSPWSATAFWEMGLLDRSDWQGQWIGAAIVGGPYSIPPAPYLRKGFAIDKPIASARLYATALGVYEFEINGRRVADCAFAPGRTNTASACLIMRMTSPRCSRKAKICAARSSATAGIAATCTATRVKPTAIARGCWRSWKFDLRTARHKLSAPTARGNQAKARFVPATC